MFRTRETSPTGWPLRHSKILNKVGSMIKITSLIFMALLLMTPTARGDFEADLSDTGKTNITENADQLLARAQAGDADAQLSMGALYFKGEGVARDYTEAIKWYRLAAQQGYAKAQFNLGVLYDTGLGVAQNHTEAVRWYRLAAELGLAIAQLNLGVAYAEGQGVAQSNADALRWFLLAARQGDAQAQFNLGVMYAKGFGTMRNYIEAYRWAGLAAVQGHQPARALMQALSGQMTREQMDRVNMPASLDKTNENPALENNSTADIRPIFLQLGTFNHINQAEKFMVLLNARLGDIGHPLSLYTKDNRVSIQVGPYDSLSEARLGADRLKIKLGIEPQFRRN